MARMRVPPAREDLQEPKMQRRCAVDRIGRAAIARHHAVLEHHAAGANRQQPEPERRHRDDRAVQVLAIENLLCTAIQRREDRAIEVQQNAHISAMITNAAVARIARSGNSALTTVRHVYA